MSIILDALNNIVDDKSDKWFDSLISELESLIDNADKDTKKNGLNALKIIRDNKDKFVGLGKKSFIHFMTVTAAGRSSEAAKIYYREKASAQEIIDSIMSDAFDIEKTRREVEALKKESLELFKLLVSGAKYILPILITMAL